MGPGPQDVKVYRRALAGLLFRHPGKLAVEAITDPSVVAVREANRRFGRPCNLTSGAARCRDVARESLRVIQRFHRQRASCRTSRYFPLPRASSSDLARSEEALMRFPFVGPAPTVMFADCVSTANRRCALVGAQ